MEPERIWHVVTNPAWRPLTESDLPGYSDPRRRGRDPHSAHHFNVRLGRQHAATDHHADRPAALALLLAVLLALRPSAAITEIPSCPRRFIIVIDSSESMSIKDEASSRKLC